eukprot:Gregarina_sp_Poly_1__408@NODE_10_length_23460_cov_121_463087_g8_i1_p7_GENE_NODE_10_length_23460_cov_121_463087_g8_i1NODE_10_length_23460_cov_121_463087_g8_i1_p7_ORF_typecomplete_len376_score32_80DUF818/PF05677_12/1_1e12Hydrolase_4/PF12146_8/2_1e11Abhydrolase_2/PF02230_16/1_6e05Abhydrolase_1/PF00561_20/2_7e05DUF1057/PF06342_12/0_0041Peptidase_S9/PF00326_21/0_0011Abhydrolase_3/PF07859_13/0_0055Abhydrolase_6/PF12697_7/1_1e04Abhydrolase_6/PF12697_7/0_031Abhydrolase_5/PF12695_7/0_34FSH1/PF03959_13/0_
MGQCNSVLFPHTPPTYKATNIDGLFWVPASLSDLSRAPHSLAALEALWTSAAHNPAIPWIPAQYFPAKGGGDAAKHLLLYFHGNSCDLGDMVEEMRVISDMTGRHVVHFEYPGYGICEGMRFESPYLIDDWGRAVAFFLIALGCPVKSMVPFGRSIGTGPAARLARQLTDIYGSVGGLILHSPYLSIHSLVADYATKMGTLFIANYWDTKDELLAISAKNIPLLCIHGRADEVIGVRHGIELFNTYMVSPAIKMGVFPLTSEHNAYVVVDDLVNPIKSWLVLCCDVGMLHTIMLSFPDWTRRRPPVVMGLDVNLASRPRSMSLALDTRPVERASTSWSGGSGLTKVLLCGCSSPGSEGDGSPVPHVRSIPSWAPR